MIPCNKFDSMRNLLFILLIISSIATKAQWPVVYGQEYYWAYPNHTRETYDKGFIVTFDYQHNPGMAYNSALLKVDINGNLLWKKVLANQSKYMQIRGLDVDHDGGVIISGRTCINNDLPDAFVMKLNACMQPEWCNIYNTPSLEDLAGEIIFLPFEDTYILSLTNSDSEERVQLMKIDSSGHTLWRNVYANNPDYISELPIGLEYSALDTSVILSAFVYAYEDSSGMYCAQPYWSKINTYGDFLWELYHIPDTSFTYGIARRRPLLTNNGNIIAPAVTSYNSHLVSIGKYGNYEWIRTLYQPDTAIAIVVNSASILNDNVYLGVQYFNNGFDPIGKGALQKNDTLGNFIGEVVLPVDFTSTIFDICNSFDNKLLITAGHDMSLEDFMLIKYNENLESDSVYTYPYIYDSLCPWGITSGSIEMACDVITGIENEIKKGLSTLKLAPNPADEYTVVYLPETVATKETQGVFNVTTYRSDYVKNLSMDIYDIYGHQVYSSPWPDQIKEKVLNISDWKPGIYMIRIFNSEQIISTGKLLVK